jgi:hypothetical protein
MESHIAFPEVIDNTMLNTFRSCPRKFELMYLQHWKGKSDNVHLHAGKAFAEGLERARRSFYDGGFADEDAQAHGLRQLMQAYGNYECPPESAKSLERMCGALEYYFDAWPMPTDNAKPWRGKSGQSAIEFSFAEPIEDFVHPVTCQPLIYSGRADMVVEMVNGLFIEDDKTTSQLGSRWAQQWEMRPQFTGYCWAARKIGIPVDGVLIRGVSILKTKYDHAQAITYRPQWEIDRWYEQMIRDLKRMEMMWKRLVLSHNRVGSDFDYNIGEACNEYGGCPMLPICKKPNPQEWLPEYFHQRYWNPLTREEEELT